MVKENVLKKILDAAVDEFLLKGVEGGSMESIARLAEVSKRTLYKYFSKKEEIFDALILELLEISCGFPHIAYSKTESIEKQIGNILSSKSELLTSDDYIKTSRLVLSEVLKGRKLAENHLEKFYESELRFIKWIDAAKKDKKITSKQPSELIANQVHSIVKGQLFYPVIFGFKVLKKKDIEIAQETTITFFLNTFCE